MNEEGAAEATLAAGLVRKVRPLLAGTPAWVVGGSVRDAVLGREVSDLDIAVQGEARVVARKVADELGGAAFELSSEYPTWRAVSREGHWQVDVAELRGDGIEADLALRDFTVGAVAVDLESGRAIDPLGGLEDLAVGLVRATGPETFTDDPLRIMRAARLVSQFDWVIDEDTASLARESAPNAGEPAGERSFEEFCKLLDGARAMAGVAAMDRMGLFDEGSVLPEVGRLKGVVQGPNHHPDVVGHTLEVLEGVIGIEDDLSRFVGDSAAATADLLAESLGGGATRSTGLRLAGLFHDIAKPDTRSEAAGFISFRGHDQLGVEMIDAIFGRLKAGKRVTRFVDDLTRFHLILGFMVPERPLSRRQQWFYLDHTEPVSVEVTLLTVADRLAARGNSSIASQEMVDGHLLLAREMVEAAIDWRRDGRPAPFLGGDELADELGIEPGPELGKVIKELEAARYAGEIESAGEAVSHARGFLAEQ